MAGQQTTVLVHFGAELRLYRTKAGLTQEQLGDRLGYSNGLVSQVEHGRRMPSRELAENADEILGTGGVLSRLWPLVREHSVPSPRFRDYLDREASATAIHTYEPQLIPGLLQTEDYARAVMQAGRPTPTPEEVQARVAARLSRQEVLTRQPALWLWAIIGEAALHIRTGTPKVMAAQLTYVLGETERTNVTVQVLPYSAGIGPAIGLAFLIAEFGDGTYAFHVDAFDQFSVGAAPGDVDERRRIFEHLRAVSLPEDASAALIAATAEEWK